MNNKTVSAEKAMEMTSKVSYCSWDNNLNISDKALDIYADNQENNSLLLKQVHAKIIVASIMTIVVDKCIM